MKKALLLFSVVLLIAVVGYGVYLQQGTGIDSVLLETHAGGGVTQDIQLYHDDGYYAFLPSYEDMSTCRIKYSTGVRLYLDGKYYDSASSLSNLLLNQPHKLIMKNIFGATVCEDTLTVMKAQGIATLSLTLKDGEIDELEANQEVSKTGYASLIQSDKTLAYYGEFKALHGRGNTSWKQVKKSYSLSLPQDEDLLGMGASDSWALISNVFDESSLRNKLAYDMAKAMDVAYAVDAEYVDLYIDGNYRGLYLLCEKPEVGKNRVEITDSEAATQRLNSSPLYRYEPFEIAKNGCLQRGFDIPSEPEDITGGYLVQIEHHKSQIKTEPNLFQTPNLTFTVSHPKYAGKRQMAYLSKLFNQTEQDIRKGDLSDIDVDSFVRYYLVQELFANTDDSSFYYYKDIDSVDPKIHSCCIWDLDLTLGSCWQSPNKTPEFLYKNKTNWFGMLYQNEAFFSKIKEYYASLMKPQLATVFYDSLNRYTEIIQPSFTMDKVRWKKACDGSNVADKSQQRYATLNEHRDAIKAYMHRRITYLDTQWID